MPDLDPEIAFLEINEITRTVVEVSENETKKVKTKRTLESGKCGMNGFNYNDKSEIKKFSIDKMTCVKRKDYNL
jgi:hypothetical protein